MRKRALVTALCAVALIGVVGVGATLAYFTDSENATNVVTMGKVDISLTEPTFGAENPENHISDVVPGQIITKDPTITVAEDSQPAYLRAKIEFKQGEQVMDEKLASELEALLKDSDGNLLTASTMWLKGDDGYYYYQEAVDPGDSILLFNSVTIPETWENDVRNMEFDIVISAEAIQAENFDPYNSEGQITAWTYTNGDPITAETYVAPEAE